VGSNVSGIVFAEGLVFGLEERKTTLFVGHCTTWVAIGIHIEFKAGSCGLWTSGVSSTGEHRGRSDEEESGGELHSGGGGVLLANMSPLYSSGLFWRAAAFFLLLSFAAIAGGVKKRKNSQEERLSQISLAGAIAKMPGGYCTTMTRRRKGHLFLFPFVAA